MATEPMQVKTLPDTTGVKHDPGFVKEPEDKKKKKPEMEEVPEAWTKDEKKADDKKVNGVDPDARKPIWVDGKATWPLRKKVIAHGDEVAELTLREPTAADIERIGNPVKMNMFEQKPEITFDAPAMTQMLSLLAIVPPSTIRQMHPKDWNNGAWILANFFVPDL